MPALVKPTKGDTARPRISADLSDALLLETRDLAKGTPMLFANADLLAAADDAHRQLYALIPKRRL